MNIFALSRTAFPALFLPVIYAPAVLAADNEQTMIVSAHPARFQNSTPRRRSVS
jgi:iron complex outermembrane receptor protein